MKLLLPLFLLAQIASGQILNMTWSRQYSYSTQLNGSNGAVNNGRYSNHDTTRATWCADDRVFVTGNDGYGPQHVIGGSGSAIFLNTMSDFSPATWGTTGVLETLVNPMSSYGHSAQDIFSNGTSMKTEGILCRKESGVDTLYWSVYQQWSGSDPTHGWHPILIKSLDYGATWCNSAHTNHTTGACTVTPSATGDVPIVTDVMLDDSIKFQHFFQYCKDNTITANCPAVDRNDVYQYGYSVSELATHAYAYRVLITDMKKMDGTLYQWYKGGNWLSDSSWDVSANKIPIEPSIFANDIADVSDPLYIPAFHTYVTLFGPGTTAHAPAFYQSQTGVGPWTLLFQLPLYTSSPDGDESWNAPVIKSLVMTGNVATINYLTTMGPPEIVFGQATNRYNPIFHVATFTGPVGVQVTGVTNTQAVIQYAANSGSSNTLMRMGPPLNYNDQAAGFNGWPNNGRYIDLDTLRTTWADDDKTYATGNDGFGINLGFGFSGRNMFLFSISDFTTPANGVLATLVNSMDDYGTATQLNTNGWTDGFSWKTDGLESQNGRLYWQAARQDPGNYFAYNASIIWSDDHGGTWCNGQHTNHTTGACTITPSATGDAPTGGQGQWAPATGIGYLKWIQYGKDGVGGPVLENNTTYKYGIASSSDITHLYTFRLLLSDMRKVDPTTYQWYKGGSCTADSSWGAPGDTSVKIATEPTGSTQVFPSSAPIYMPAFGKYIMWAGSDVLPQLGFFQSTSACGPWTLVLQTNMVEQTVQWFAPILKSLSGNTITFIHSSSVSGRDTSYPPNNLYSLHFREVTMLPDQCIVEVSESPTYLPLVNDVNPAMFANANMDIARTSTVANGRARTVVVGKRTAEHALDGWVRSRALQQNTKHYYRRSCGKDVVTGTFDTAAIPLGATFNEGIPPDPTDPEHPLWPQLDWRSRTQTVIDPQTGLLLKQAAFPGQSTYGPPGGYSLGFDYSYGPAWTNAASGKATTGAGASINGSTSPLTLAIDATFTWSTIKLQITCAINGSPTGDDAKGQVAISRNGTTAYGPWKDFVCPTTMSTTQDIGDSVDQNTPNSAGYMPTWIDADNGQRPLTYGITQGKLPITISGPTVTTISTTQGFDPYGTAGRLAYVNTSGGDRPVIGSSMVNWHSVSMTAAIGGAWAGNATISSVTQHYPAVFTQAGAHLFTTGDSVTVSGIPGLGGPYIITVLSPTTYELQYGVGGSFVYAGNPQATAAGSSTTVTVDTSGLGLTTLNPATFLCTASGSSVPFTYVITTDPMTPFHALSVAFTYSATVDVTCEVDALSLTCCSGATIADYPVLDTPSIYFLVRKKTATANTMNFRAIWGQLPEDNIQFDAGSGGLEHCPPRGVPDGMYISNISSGGVVTFSQPTHGFTIGSTVAITLGGMVATSWDGNYTANIPDNSHATINSWSHGTWSGDGYMFQPGAKTGYLCWVLTAGGGNLIMNIFSDGEVRNFGSLWLANSDISPTPSAMLPDVTKNPYLTYMRNYSTGISNGVFAGAYYQRTRDVGQDHFGYTPNWVSIATNINAAARTFDPRIPLGMGYNGAALINHDYFLLGAGYADQDKAAWTLVIDSAGNPVASDSTFSTRPVRFAGQHGLGGSRKDNLVIRAFHGAYTNIDQNYNGPWEMILASTMSGPPFDPCPTSILTNPPFPATGNHCTLITVNTTVPTARIPAGEHLGGSLQVGDIVDCQGEYCRVVSVVDGTHFWAQRQFSNTQYGAATCVSTGDVNCNWSHAIGTVFNMPQGSTDRATAVYLSDYGAMAWWDYLADPLGLNPADPAGEGLPAATKYFESVFPTASHFDWKDHIFLNDNGYGATVLPDNGKADAIRICPTSNQRFGCAPVFSINANPAFSGLAGAAYGNFGDQHPSIISPDPLLFGNSIVSGLPIFPFFVDFQTTGIIGDNVAAIQTLASGATQVYKLVPMSVPGHSADTKRLVTEIFAGGYAIADVSAPGRMLADNASDQYHSCTAAVDGECWAGSSAGDRFANAPYVVIPPAGTGISGITCYPTVFDLCPWILGSHQGMFSQIGMQRQDIFGTDGRALTWGLGVGRRTGGTTRITPDGQWQLLPIGAGAVSSSILLAKVGSFPPYSGVNRTEFLPYPVPVPAKAGGSTAVVDYGFDENFRCSTRNDSCVANGNAVNSANPFYWLSQMVALHALGTDIGKACSSGCVINIPAISGRTVYYRMRWLSSGGATVAIGKTQVISMN